MRHDDAKDRVPFDLIQTRETRVSPHIPGPDDSLNDWLAAFAAPSPAPAGGSAAAIAGAMAAALAQMVAAMTGAREQYHAAHAQAAEVASRAERLRGRMAALATRDAEAFTAFSAALALPKGTAEETTKRDAAKARAFVAGADVQLELLASLVETAELAEAMAGRGLASALGDAGTAVFLAAAAARSACWAVRSNLEAAGGPGDGRARAAALLARVEAAEGRVARLLEERGG